MSMITNGIVNAGGVQTANRISYGRESLKPIFQDIMVQHKQGAYDAEVAYKVERNAGGVVIWRALPINGLSGDLRNTGFIDKANNFANGDGMPTNFQQFVAYAMDVMEAINVVVPVPALQTGIAYQELVENAVLNEINSKGGQIALNVNRFSIAKIVAAACNFAAGSPDLVTVTETGIPVNYVPEGFAGLFTYDPTSDNATDLLVTFSNTLSAEGAAAASLGFLEPVDMVFLARHRFHTDMFRAKGVMEIKSEAGYRAALTGQLEGGKFEMRNGYKGDYNGVPTYVVSEQVWNAAGSIINFPSTLVGRKPTFAASNLGLGTMQNIYGILASAPANTYLFGEPGTFVATVQNPWTAGAVYQLTARFGFETIIPSANLVIVDPRFVNPATATLPVVVNTRPTTPLSTAAPTITSLNIGGVAATMTGNTITLGAGATTITGQDGRQYYVVSNVVLSDTNATYQVQGSPAYYLLPANGGAILARAAQARDNVSQAYNATRYTVTIL